MREPVTVLNSLRERYPFAVGVRVVGTSMQPTFMDGDGILLDRSSRSPKDGEVVAINSEALGGVMIGRFFRSPHGAWLKKDNPDFPSVFLGKPDRYTIEGIVVAICDRVCQREVL